MIRHVNEAEAILAIRLYDVVGRTAYLAGFHAAQAFISEHTGRSVKTHNGVHAEVHRLPETTRLLARSCSPFFFRNYDLKAIADYEIGPEAEVSADRANLAVQQAKLFVAHFENVLGAPVVRHRRCAVKRSTCRRYLTRSRIPCESSQLAMAGPLGLRSHHR